MKRIATLVAGGTLILAPAAALAAGNAPHLETRHGQWVGPYEGAQIGLNQSSAAGLDTQSSLTGGVLGGYNAALPLQGAASPLILGGDVFANFNGKGDHNYGVSYGSNQIGVDLMGGIPLGQRHDFLPYVKLGMGNLSATGDLGGSEVSARIGVGAQFKISPVLALQAQWMHQDADHITNDNFTVGLNYQFSVE